MKFSLRFSALLICLFGGLIGVSDDVPIAPLLPIEHTTWGKVYILEAEQLEVVVSPEEGAVVSLKHRIAGDFIYSPLRIEPTPKVTTEASLTGNWENRAWRTSEGRQVVMLSRSVGPPLSLRIVHLIEVNATGTTFSQRTRITGTGPGDHSLLGPSFEVGLSPSPDTSLVNDAYSLRYGDIGTTWQSTWSIESPERPIESSLNVDETRKGNLLSGHPTSELALPPQGWTLLCTVNMTWSNLPADRSPEASSL